MKRLFILLAAFLFFISIPASGQIIGFEELYPGSETSEILIPNGYRGLNWSDYFKGMTSGHLPGTGYANGATGSMLAYTWYHKAVWFSSPDGSEFDFIGADLTAARLDNETVTVQGWRDGQVVYSDEIITSTDGPYSFLFYFMNVDKVKIIPNQETGDHHIAIDNIEIVPEPATMLFLAAGALVLSRKRAHQPT